MINLERIHDALANYEKLQTEIANLRRENADLRQHALRLEQERNAQQARADFYYTMATEKAKER